MRIPIARDARLRTPAKLLSEQPQPAKQTIRARKAREKRKHRKTRGGEKGSVRGPAKATTQASFNAIIIPMPLALPRISRFFVTVYLNRLNSSLKGFRYYLHNRNMCAYPCNRTDK